MATASCPCGRTARGSGEKLMLCAGCRGARCVWPDCCPSHPGGGAELGAGTICGNGHPSASITSASTRLITLATSMMCTWLRSSSTMPPPPTGVSTGLGGATQLKY